MPMPKKIDTGDVLYIAPDDITILVVMANEMGIRYIQPMNPTFDELGNIKTEFISYSKLSAWTISLGSITNISATLMGK